VAPASIASPSVDGEVRQEIKILALKTHYRWLLKVRFSF
jgi:hypothetical protein